ncbi:MULTISPECIES: phage tail sheath subtilisin-like domain-containing protein [unclassified Oceanobacter]|uniref:phage tail sheath subtilisin-like domain-containing protein n=1 Tax=unclassified Oceanobacter TaxID=2620260 RepID=UPI0027340C4D|nr:MULTISPECIES: phage tail sheath subtilisin-like domain-containing protein [unclassified Oceanobacter]MDP2607945.1 phage tail sheath subtilisin-like domain-containing protein [Oceanobacter sp. 1_MG-2023]MDP2611393.1 phage tail sheath subtilisin-like domain-containing protein [Oceanobacter sp. 2_MG-2023]
MSISFDDIPSSLRTPGAHIEFNNELAGSANVLHKMVVIGQRLSTGIQPEGVPIRVTDPSRGKTLFGQGGMIANMIAAVLDANTETELWAIALDDLAAGNAATGSIAVTTAATEAGTLYIYIGGVRVAVGIADGDDTDTIASSISAAINSNADLPVTASVSTSTVTLTARHKGEYMNGLDVRSSYYEEREPDGLAITYTSLSGGSGNPDIGPALDAMGDEWFNWLCNPYNDTANVQALETELDSRFGPMRQIGCRAFGALAGTLATMGTWGSSRNNPHLSVLGTGTSPTPTYIAAAINMAVAAKSLSNDPARPLQTLELPGVKAPRREELLTRQERNLLLYDGISTFTVARDGTVQIERQITTYQFNSAGLADASYLDICTPETLERFRYEQRAMIAQKYPRHKLADDGTSYGAGQAIVTPKIIKGELLALYKDMETAGWVEDYDTYAEQLIVERDSEDPNRVNWRDTPNLVNQARVFAGKTQFIVK